MAFPSRKDIIEAIVDLKTHVDKCAEWNVPITAKRIGELIGMSQSLRVISSSEATSYHNETNHLIKKFQEICSCTRK